MWDKVHAAIELWFRDGCIVFSCFVNASGIISVHFLAADSHKEDFWV